jgi:hypothetical protein
MSRNHAITEKQINTVQHYLEREFPGQVCDMQWDRHSDMQVFEIVYETTKHRVEMPVVFFETCSNCADTLRHSELTDYMREAQAQMRRFSVVWEDGSVRVRSTPL